MKHDLLAPEVLRTEEELVVQLASRIADLRDRDGGAGHQQRLARQLGVAACELSAVIHGHKPIRPGLATALGYRRVVRFEPID